MPTGGNLAGPRRYDPRRPDDAPRLRPPRKAPPGSRRRRRFGRALEKSAVLRMDLARGDGYISGKGRWTLPGRPESETTSLYERRHEKLAPRSLFYRRVARSSLLSLLVVFGALSLGVCGYRLIEGLPLVDAVLNASMILGGMGPVAELHTTAGKLFASFYALFSGLVFITVSGLLLAPVVHRFLHKFHLGEQDRGRS